jgi:hypothetical protein
VHTNLHAKIKQTTITFPSTNCEINVTLFLVRLMLITPAFSKKKISDLLIFGCHQNTRTPRILVIIPWQHSQKTPGELEVLFFHHLQLMQLLLRRLQIHCTAPVGIQKEKNTVLVNLQVF